MTETQSMDRTEIGKYFSDISRNSGKITFKITYTATEGNIGIDKRFQEFCFRHANNEYLAGLGLLLKVFQHYSELSSLGDAIEALDKRVTFLEEEPVKEEEPKKGPATF